MKRLLLNLVVIFSIINADIWIHIYGYKKVSYWSALTRFVKHSQRKFCEINLCASKTTRHGEEVARGNQRIKKVAVSHVTTVRALKAFVTRTP
ncbi:hypothetical protein ACROYT_G040795 [Oculina patagonica]